MRISEEDYLAHYGILRRSGRYPWGSGGPENGGNKSFVDHVESLKRKGLSEKEIADSMGATIAELRNARSIARNQIQLEKIALAEKLRAKGYSHAAIGERMAENGKPLNESTVRSLLAPGARDRAEKLFATSNMLRDQIEKKEFLDVGVGVENHLGISNTKLKTAVAQLREEGYKLHYVKVKQIATGKYTTVQVLTKGDVPYKDVFNHPEKIQQITDFTYDGGKTFLGIHEPLSIDSSRVGIRYKEDGGAAEDGILYIRPNVPDVSIGKSRYAQVRVMVDGSHYIKGVAIYKDDLPKGVDILFNTSKGNTGNKLDALKELKESPEGGIDKDNPFGASIRRQLVEKDANGQDRVTSAMNIVNEEGNWETWSKTLATQVLSKQSPTLAKRQLDVTLERKKAEFDEIMSLTNPTVRKKLLDSFADDADSSAVHLEAALPNRSAWHVILPVNSMKENEVYAPNFRNGERVALIRYPHGGTFEIPELTVNNKHPEARNLIGSDSKDAIGIHAKVAERLSGADFDGDTVLVIPNNSGQIKSTPALEGLKKFDPRDTYRPYDGMKTIDGKVWSEADHKAILPEGHTANAGNKHKEMGQITNLIADMTIRKASTEDLAAAVRHSMVIIDAEKHSLDYRRSAQENGIQKLKQKYQIKEDGKTGGASTLITRATSETRVPDLKPRRAADGGPIDRLTGEKKFDPNSAETYVDRSGAVKVKTRVSTKLAETSDAHTLSSGTPIEKIYADHSNSLKALANEARKASVNTTPIKMSPSAKQHYAAEVARLDSALNIALRNAPLERQAQLIANATFSARKAANPTMDSDTAKKIKNQALVAARARTGAGKKRIEISPSEWAAIQAGAISNNKLEKILANTDIDKVKQLATPKSSGLMSTTVTARAKQMIASGFTQAEIADQLGVSVSTLKRGLKDE